MTHEEVIKQATEATLTLFPGCELWSRDGDFMKDPASDDEIYLPLADVMKLRCPDGNHEMINQILSIHHGIQCTKCGYRP